MSNLIISRKIILALTVALLYPLQSIHAASLPEAQDVTVKKMNRFARLTWKAPLTDASDLLYTVRRSAPDSTFVVLSEKQKGTDYIDVISDIDTRQIVNYTVTVISGSDSSAAVASNPIIVGPAYELPFTETFGKDTDGTCRPDNLWLTDGDKWEFTNHPSYSSGGTTVDVVSPAADGVAMTGFGPQTVAGTTAALTSGSINMGGIKNAMLSVDYYAVSSSGNIIEVQISVTDGPYETLDIIDAGEGDTGWKKATFLLDAYAKDVINFRFMAVAGEAGIPVFIDAVTVSADAVDDVNEFVSDGIKYSVTDRSALTVAVAGYPSDNIDAVIPAKVTYGTKEYTVTGIADKAFYSMTTLNSVVIPQSVTSIGKMAFWGCQGLTSVTMSDSITSIGEGAFLYCYALSDLTFPAALEEIGSFAFGNCLSLEKAILPEGLRTVDENAFQYCLSIKEAVIPASLAELPPSMFVGCSSLSALTLPASLEFIGAGAFEGCSSLTAITIPDMVEGIYAYTFSNCTSLREVEMSASLASISTGSFDGCTSLSLVTFKTATPPVTADDAFNGIAPEAKGVCPPEAYEAYSAVTGLKPLDFTACSAIDDIKLTGGEGTVRFYNLKGIATDSHGGETLIRVVTSPDGTVTVSKIRK